VSHRQAAGGHEKSIQESSMTKLFSSLAACTFIVGLSLAGVASAEDAMKSDTMKKDNMQSSAMSKDTMKTSGPKTDCMNKAGMEKDAMRKADMMKACDAM
jgi:pentapeptide MXKDX repeat protein